MEQRMEMAGGGTLVLTPLDGRVILCAEKEDCRDGLYKVWLKGEGGRRCLMGTLVPEGAGFRLTRTVAVRELEMGGCWPLAGAEAVRVFAFSNQGPWNSEEHPERMFKDPVLREQVRGAMLCRKGKSGFQLASRFRKDRPVALPGLFCFSRLKEIGGQLCMVWDFDWDGTPQMPEYRD